MNIDPIFPVDETRLTEPSKEFLTLLLLNDINKEKISKLFFNPKYPNNYKEHTNTSVINGRVFRIRWFIKLSNHWHEE